jgi:hypothetical protein
VRIRDTAEYCGEVCHFILDRLYSETYSIQDIRGSEMVISRMLSLSTRSIGVGALDIRTRVRRLQDLAALEESLTEEMVGLVRFLVQAELLFEISAYRDVPYRAAFVVDLATRLDTKESIVEKLMRANS